MNQKPAVNAEEWARNQLINCVMEHYSFGRATAEPMADAYIALVLSGAGSTLHDDVHTLFLTVAAKAFGRGEQWGITALPQLIAHPNPWR
ncbi:hypothetical protein ACFVT5_41140 [Streptomyces sp. NPDC058001]|uniref:hypothetical protein n=1 Tax=Streptomyces sp. NPDC058001 TaxID=3346300 RepID=UPI0036E5A846